MQCVWHLSWCVERLEGAWEQEKGRLLTVCPPVVILCPPVVETTSR